MRLTIVSRIFTPEPSAASFFLDAVAREFADRGHEITVITARPRRGVKVQSTRGIRVKRFPVLRDSTGYVRGYVPYMSFDVPVLFRILFGRKADVYLVEPPPTTGAVVRLALMLLRRPYIYDAADIWSDAAKLATSSQLILRILLTLEKFALAGAAHIVTISTGVARRISEMGISVPTTIAGFGVDGDVFRFRTEAQELSTERPYFIYAGTYSEVHGALIFVEAFARFARNHPQFELLFVGNGTERSAIERAVNEASLTNVRFIPTLGAFELNVLLNGAVASLASLRPGQGYDYAFATKVYSSMASGCPVVFSGIGPTHDFLSEEPAVSFGNLTVDYDSLVIAEALAQLAAHPISPALRRDQSDWVRENFAISATARLVESVAQDLVTTGILAKGRAHR